MRVLQRIVATIILLAFLPTSIAAALPLVYCIGADGHRAVEYIGCDDHAHGAPGATAQKTSVEHQKCIDLKYAPVAQLVQRDAKGDLALADDFPPLSKVVLASADLPLADEGPSQPKVAALGAQRGAIDYLTAHKTIVLLI